MQRIANCIDKWIYRVYTNIKGISVVYTFIGGTTNGKHITEGK